MDKFCYFHRVYKEEFKTEYSSINFEGYSFDVGKMEKYLSEYVLSRENLRFIFVRTLMKSASVNCKKC